MANQRRRRLWLGAAGIGIALVLGGLVLWTAGALRPEPETPGAAARAAAHPPPAAAAAARPSPGAVAVATATAAGNTGGVESAAKAFGRATAEDYRRRARYPHSSQPLAEGEDPLLRDREVSPITAAGEGGAEPTLTVFPEQVSFQSPEPVRLFAYLSASGERLPAGEITAEVLDQNLQPLASLVYRDDGEEGDATAGDRLYSALFQPGDLLGDRLSASFMVRVRATTAGGERRDATTGFLYGSPDAVLSGRFRDSLDGGDLLIGAEVEVRAAGRFHLEASLYAPDGRPLAWAQNAAELSPGRQWISLRYYGLILHEQGIDGPYRLRFAALSTTTRMPNAKNDLLESSFLTQPYAAADFTSTPFDDPGLLDAARRVERDTGGGG